MGQVGAGRCSPGVDQSSRGCQPPSVCLDVETGATVRECERSCDWKIDSREMTFIFFFQTVAFQIQVKHCRKMKPYHGHAESPPGRPP